VLGIGGAVSLAGAASAGTGTPSFSMTDNYGEVWSLSSAGATNGTQNYTGIVTNTCGSNVYCVTATKMNDPAAGTWDWTFTGTNPNPVNPPNTFCATSFTLIGTGIGNLSGTWTNSLGDSGVWTSCVTKGPGTTSPARS
jgi:hypothetical protein